MSSAPAVSFNCLKLPLTILQLDACFDTSRHRFFIKTHRFDSAHDFEAHDASVHNSAILQRIPKPAISNTDLTPLASVNSSDDYSCFSQCYVLFLALILAHRKILQDKFLHWHLNVLLTCAPWRLQTGTAYYKRQLITWSFELHHQSLLPPFII